MTDSLQIRALIKKAMEQDLIPVRGYVKAVLAHRQLKARLDAKEERLRPLRNRTAIAAENVRRRRERMTGGQLAAADRVLALQAEDRDLLLRPCR